MERVAIIPLSYWPSGSQAAPAQVARRAGLDEQTQLANLAMARYASGEERAFEELYRLLSPRLYRLCIYLSGRNDAEELLQETFLKMHRARATFVPEGSVIAWSFAIARTTHLDRLRRRKRRPEAPIEQAQLETRAADAGSDPESASNQRALEVVLESELARLSETLRSAYVLVKIEGLSSSEAATVLGASTSAVKQRVHRAMEELKLGLAESGWAVDAAE